MNTVLILISLVIVVSLLVMAFRVEFKRNKKVKQTHNPNNINFEELTLKELMDLQKEDVDAYLDYISKTTGNFSRFNRL